MKHANQLTGNDQLLPKFFAHAQEFGYYQSIRDTGVDIFAERIPKGTSELNYELIVAHSGEFTSGPAILQCMYQPANTAYSKTTNVKVTNENKSNP